MKNTAWQRGQDRHLHAEAAPGDNGSGMHCHQSLFKGGEPLFYDANGYAGLSDMGAPLHRRPPAPRAGLLAFTNPTVNSLPPPRARLRGAGQPGVLEPEPLGLHPHPDHRRQPEGQAPRVPGPDPSGNPYLAFAAMLMAGLDGIKNKIEPPDAGRQGPLRAPAGGGRRHPAGAGLASRGARRTRGRPRLPARGRRLHLGPDRDLGRATSATSSTRSAAAPAPVRVRAVLQLLITRS